MRIIIEPKTSIAVGDFGAAAASLTLTLEGRKKWLAFNRLQFETSGANVAAIRDRFPSAVVEDAREASEAAELLGEPETTPTGSPAPAFVLPPRDFQLANFERFKDKLFWAIFSEQGTGKTKVAFDIISHRFLRRMTTAVIVLSNPKGVHAQWIEEQLGKHLWHNVPVLAYVWDGKAPPKWVGRETPKMLQMVSGNIDMLRSAAGYALLEKIANQHRERLLILIDEADSIKNKDSQRSKLLRKLAEKTRQRGILTGTPIAKNLEDEWSEFYFLDPDVIGHKYRTSFRAQFCKMGGFENREVVGHRNLELFKSITAPHVFRATKDELDLPEKVYDEIVFDLTKEQKRIIKEIREKFFSDIDEKNGSTAASSGATALLRIQQVSNGFVISEDGSVVRLDNPRLEALQSLRRQVSGSMIIWCRFKEDVRIVREALGGVTIFGEDNDKQRAAAKDAFLRREAENLIATPGAAGKGVDGLQTVCGIAAYYSNSYNAIDRWQSEDRIHRIGMQGTATYFDLIGRGSPDRSILTNLRNKKALSTLVLDDVKKIMEELS